MSGNFGLKINEEVLAKMASMAAAEVEGVHCISAKAADIKGVVDRGGFGRGVKASVAPDGEITITVFISIKQGAHVKDVAERVQANVKEKVQNMTGFAVSRVNVSVADVELVEATPEETEE